MVERFASEQGGSLHTVSPDCRAVCVQYVKAHDYDALQAKHDNLAWNLDGCMESINNLTAEVTLRKEALAWVIEHFNTFDQPPEHLKCIVDDACLKAMTADEDAVRMTERTSAGVKSE